MEVSGNKKNNEKNLTDRTFEAVNFKNLEMFSREKAISALPVKTGIIIRKIITTTCGVTVVTLYGWSLPFKNKLIRVIGSA